MVGEGRPPFVFPFARWPAPELKREPQAAPFQNRINLTRLNSNQHHGSTPKSYSPPL